MKAVIAAAVWMVALSVGAGEVEYSVRSTVKTNEVEASVYKKYEAGQGWTNRHSQVSGWTVLNDRTLTLDNAVCNVINPFTEQVTTTYYRVVSNDLYRVHIGSMSHRYATVVTVLKRWKVVVKKKISVSESSEVVEE